MVKVFIVEDEIVIRESIHKMIPWAEYGFEYVGEASDGEMALPLIRELRPNLVITDVRMPFMDGLTLCKLIKEEFPETKIIIISGYDDFEYARRAISLGVEQYLLKPIRRVDFIEVLENTRKKFEAENEQKIYIEKFQREMQEYEKDSRRDFFELLVSKEAEETEIERLAGQLGMDIMAECYNLIFFALESRETEGTLKDKYSQKVADMQEQIWNLFSNRDEFLLFRNQTFSYVVLVKGKREEIKALTEECAGRLKKTFEIQEKEIDWVLCVGRQVENWRLLSECYKEGMRLFSYRYMGYQHVLSEETVRDRLVQKGDLEEDSIRNLDIDAVDPAIIKNFLCNAQENEVPDFIENYIRMVGEGAFRSEMFRQYILLNIHFSAVSFVQMLGYDRAKIDEYLGKICNPMGLSEDEVKGIIANILTRGIQLRIENSKGKYQGIISKAIQFMEQNFQDENLSLNSVACVANVSANHFSALFSQEVGQTFIEYLTGIRMKRAKELLKCTDKRSGEIAFEVGYKDSHYFSFLFKKTQGCTPSEYRNQKGQEQK